MMIEINQLMYTEPCVNCERDCYVEEATGYPAHTTAPHWYCDIEKKKHATVPEGFNTRRLESMGYDMREIPNGIVDPKDVWWR